MISAVKLTKMYGKTKALEDIGLDVSPNEILALIGPSGCGKTTLLRVIAGLERPDEGRVLIDDSLVDNRSKWVQPNKRGLSMVFQDLALWPHMTVRGHIEFVLKAKRLSKNVLKSEINQILKNVNLNDHNSQYPHQLSGGERQRLAIGRALASSPAYLLMDEPLSNLDSLLKEDLQGLIIGLKNRLEMGIVYVTHNIEEALVLADRIAIMNQGRLEQIDDKDRILSRPKNDFVRRFLGIK